VNDTASGTRAPARGTTLAPALLAGCLLAALATLPLSAVISGGGPLDGLLDEADAVAVVRVTAILEPDDWESIAFDAERLEVLAGGEVPAQLRLTVPRPVWPADLGLSYEVGATLIVSLERGSDGTLDLINNERAILPAGDGPLPPGSRGVRARVFAVLRALLDRDGDDVRRAHLLLMLGQIAGPRDEQALATYLDEGGVWTRRAALGALLRLDPTAERVQLAEDDGRSFLAAPPPAGSFERWLFRRLYEGALDDRRISPPGGAERVRPFLPIYRAIADASEQSGLADLALDGLQRVGDGSDVQRLARYTASDDPCQRLDALDALCRLFGSAMRRPQVTSCMMPLPPEAVAQEQRMRAAVGEALQRERLPPLPAKDERQ
jgi:hypothetical protein